ncbi:hypothetical protein ACQKII_03825 [Lysinibacillus sp. NPDC048646]|uniref:hypothetical protein n=1 Tax=Lysinibacillus sp. NPDC048646 TaxID=3390574 RepID=UPI003D080EE3
MEILNSTVYFQKLDLLASLYAGQEALKKTMPRHTINESQLGNYEQLEVAIRKLNKEIRVLERNILLAVDPSGSIPNNTVTTK